MLVHEFSCDRSGLFAVDQVKRRYTEKYSIVDNILGQTSWAAKLSAREEETC